MIVLAKIIYVLKVIIGHKTYKIKSIRVITDKTKSILNISGNLDRSQSNEWKVRSCYIPQSSSGARDFMRNFGIFKFSLVRLSVRVHDIDIRSYKVIIWSLSYPTSANSISCLQTHDLNLWPLLLSTVVETLCLILIFLNFCMYISRTSLPRSNGTII